MVAGNRRTGRRSHELVGPVLGLVTLCCGAARADVVADYRRAERAGSAKLNRLVYKRKVEPHWIDGGPRFWYRNDVRGEKEFVLVDPDKARRAPAFDHARLVAALAKALDQPVEARRLPFAEIEFADGGKAVEFVAGGKRWLCDLATYACRAAGPSTRPARRRPPGREGPPKRPSDRSPDGKLAVFVRDHNLLVREVGGTKEVALTTDGSEAHAYGSPSWSPDSGRLVAFRTTPGDNREMHVIESAPKGELRPKLHTYAYALPGDRLAVHEMWVYDAGGGGKLRVETEPIDYGGPPKPRWRPDGRHFTFEQTHRGHQRVRIVEADSHTGAARTVLDERSETFVAPMKRFVHYVDDGRQVLWASERDGWNHLYLFDGQTGKLVHQVTRGKWVVRGVQRVDEKKRQVWFTAGGREAGQDPYLVHHYRVSFDGSGLVCLTPGNGTHEVAYSPDGKYLLDTYSRTDSPPVAELRRVADGALVCPLETADVHDLLAAGWRFPEPFAAKGRDGKTDIWGVIHRPSNLDASAKYPVIECIYAGPQGSFVPKAFGVRSGVGELAELGFLVVQIDGMGTSNRSKAFHDVCYRNLADGGFPDRIAWMRAAARKYPTMDLSRVGIYGGSAGGYNAARALIAHGDFYRAAIALSGNHDHRTDKTWWNELWMGWPVGEHYREQSNVTNAAKLRGRLLLIHGELDRNVNPHASTMQLVDALIKADRNFDMLIVPGAGHGPGGGHVKRRQWDYFVRHLRGVEPPESYRMGAAGGTGRECHITIRNRTNQPVAIYWLSFDGGLKKYHDLQPGEEKRQRTFDGHEWEAHAAGRAISTCTASEDRPVWNIDAPKAPTPPAGDRSPDPGR